ncbi:MAG: 50S ribosomal protein L11 methyltransferase [Alphaproteobacteria bacterium]|nr:50S ribosomal protein L11 methyltransferase [Alphaproteobacteria bacterium]
MSSLWRIALTVPGSVLQAVADALQPFVTSLTTMGESPDGTWLIEGLVEHEPERPAVIAALSLAAATVGHPPPDTVIEPLPEVDWLALNRQSFPPIREGRIWIRGSHVVDPVPAGTLALTVDAARAFGSGSHATTALCLRAIQDLAKQRRPRRVLDLGCGSGILAMAWAKLCPGSAVRAVDLDPISVATAAANARLNGVHDRVRAAVSDGWRSPVVRRDGPYDVVTANILARPLCAMAKDLRYGLAPGGVAVLSGLLNEQERWVLSAHRAQGLQLRCRYRRDGWSALVISRR